MNKFILIIVTIIIISLIFSCSVFTKHNDVEWTMVNENYSGQQADAHVIQIKNGKTILIDAGHQNTAGNSLVPFLRKRSINELDLVFISHPHNDHYGGLNILLNNGIKIKEIYFNIPEKSICDKEIPWGCDYNDILALHDKLKNKGIIVKIATAGQKFNLGNNTWIEILYAFDGINTPVGKTDINDLSLIMMLHHNQYKFLFTGDLNKKLGRYLAGLPSQLSANIIKVPHHGTENVAPNSFFKKINPQYALVPAPKHLWLSERSKRIRNFFSNNKIPVYVNGISGDIQVTINGNTLSVNTEKTNSKQ
jgi:competence protein ComEC